MNKRKGSTLDSFLEDEDLLADAEAVAIKRVIAYELKKKMKKAHLSKSEIADEIGTSRSGLTDCLIKTILL